MIIDFHTHVFPDNIAPKAIAALESSAEMFGLKAIADGTIASLKTSMKNTGIDCSVTFGVATKPAQVPSINKWAIENNDPDSGIIFFGAMHPDYENQIDEINRIKNAGLKGIKLHGEFQKFPADSEKMFTVYQILSDANLFVIFHCGDDLFAGNSGNSSAVRVRKVADKFPNLKIIAAHGGAFKQWDESIEHLSGKENIWIDISFLPGYITDELWNELLESFGYEKILLGSDFPWMAQRKVLDWLKSKNLDEKIVNAILGGNAVELLNLNLIDKNN